MDRSSQGGWESGPDGPIGERGRQSHRKRHPPHLSPHCCTGLVLYLTSFATRSPAAAAANAHSWGKGAPSEKSCDPKSLLGRSHDVIQGRKIESTSYIAVTPASCFVGSSSKSCVGLHRCKWSRTGLGWRGTLGRGDESHQEKRCHLDLKDLKVRHDSR